MRSFALFCLAMSPVIYAQSLNSTMLKLIRDRMNEGAKASWEIGTKLETLIEVDYSSLSVFDPNYLTLTPPSASTLGPVLTPAKTAINSMTNDQFIEDGSAADPASLGVAVLLGNRTDAPGANWAQAAARQLNALLNETPRSEDGAISHRTEYVQLWSDFVYMAPPFLAYYGVLTSNTTIIDESYNQISLYRKHLFDSKQSLWRHIISLPLGPDSPAPSNSPNPNNSNGFNDTGHWSTGNGWAAAGMLRVIGTLQNSPFAKQYGSKIADIQHWVGEIHGGMSSRIPSSGIFTNYVDDPTSFDDAASTALFAGTVYRAMTLYQPGKYGKNVDAAEKARNALYVNEGSIHFDTDGWIQPVVNPNSFSYAGSQSPEAQCFALQLDNNWNGWKAAGSKSSALRSSLVSPVLPLISLFIALFALI